MQKHEIESDIPYRKKAWIGAFQFVLNHFKSSARTGLGFLVIAHEPCTASAVPRLQVLVFQANGKSGWRGGVAPDTVR